ncbi:MAG TPA: hypothetical protein VJN94_03735 [Candidatus Binataceae bacterium]|nr:hypothetical protein [Candidatus Binataceae bacterium]
MVEEKFETNLLRAVAAELQLLNGLTVAREMFGKGYFALGAAEKALVDQTVNQMIVGNYRMFSAEFLRDQAAKPLVGFQAPVSDKLS